MQRWHAIIEYLTPAGALRTWDTEVVADTAEDATELAMRTFKLSRPGLVLPEIVGVELEPIHLLDR